MLNLNQSIKSENGVIKFPITVHRDILKGGYLLFELKANVWNDGQKYVAHFPPLGMYGFGDTKEEALKMLSNGVELQIQERKYKVIFTKE